MRKQKNINQEKIKELAKKRKEMQEELDELKGNTVKGKIICALIFCLSVGLLLGLFTGMVKLDIGGAASKVLAPAIGDVPVLRSILPAEMQKETASELAAKRKQTEAEQAVAKAEAEAEAEAEQAAAEAKAAAEAEQAAAEAKAAAEAEAAAKAKAEADAEAAAALQDYVDTYSAMAPEDAAKIFESMIPAQSDSVVRILVNLAPDQRAAILSKMDVTNAALMTERMKQ